MKPPSKRPTFGVLINNLDQPYQREFWNGIEAAADRYDVNVIIFEGGVINSPLSKEIERNRTYDYVTSGNIDGLIIVSTVIANFISQKELMDRFRHLIETVPTVNIGPPLPGVFSAWVENKDGMAAVTEHLITAHGKKKLLFMGASDNHLDGVERRDAFLSVLRKHGLEPLESGILSGLFIYENARDALSAWLEKGIEFDAVVAANDDMAYACYDELTRRGYSIPDRIAVTGFDDVPSARFFSVPLTTVRQPIYELGYLAVETIHGSKDAVQNGSRSILPAEAVIRQSCGCLPRETIIAGGISMADESQIPCCTAMDNLEHLFQAAMEGRVRGTDFLNSLQKELRSPDQTSPGMETWENFISRLRVHLENSDLSRTSVTEGETILHQARTILRNKSETSQATQLIRYLQRSLDVQYVFSSLIGSFSLAGLMESLRASMPRLGIKSCFLSLFTPESGGKRSRLAVGYADNRDFMIPGTDMEFDTCELFPRHLLPEEKRYNFFAELLFHRSAIFGIIVMEINPEDGVFSDALTSQIRSALKASLLMDELVEKDQKLKNAFDQLTIRADELQKANDLIRRNQDQLLISEKMASLGRLTAGIAHEMNTPIAAVRASITELLNLVDEYKSSIADADVSPEDHLAIAADMEKSLRLAASAGDKAAAFIRGIKTQTRDAGKDAAGIAFDVTGTVNEALELLAHAVRSGKCTTELKAPEKPLMVFGKPGKIAQILSNLVTNAIDAMTPSGGRITVLLAEEDGSVRISVTDHGCGIAGENLKRIFDPLFTTKPFGVGTGLGLTIVHDIICGEFGGTVNVESEPGKGSTFTVTLPRNTGA